MKRQRKGKSDQWIKTCQGILHQVKSRVFVRTGKETAGIARYRKAFDHEFQSQWHASTKDELIREVLRSHIVLAGDFHAYHQSQRVQLRILRALPESKGVCLGVEFLESDHQIHIDAYMAGTLAENEFLEIIQWNTRWGFPWEHYRPILDLARTRGFDVVGLNRHYAHRTNETLLKRDTHAAGIIATYHLCFPKKLIYVIYGELHLARGHLPARIREELPGVPVLIMAIFQNSEKIYFQLARRGLEIHINIVKLSGRRFCVMSTPPWVQWQSYLMLLEKMYDQDLDDDEEWEPLDFTEQVHNYIKLISAEFHLKMALGDFSVFGPGSRQLFDQIEDSLTDRDRSVAQLLYNASRSFFLPSEGIFYLSRGTVNHAAELVGHYLQSRLSGRTRPLWRMPEDFQKSIWLEALGFFSSKLINHQRKPESLDRADTGLDPKKRESHDARLLALEYSSKELFWLSDEKPYTLSFKSRRKIVYFEASRILGSILGERLYLAYRSNALSRLEIVECFQTNVDSEIFLDLYRRTVKRVRPIPKLFQSSAERL